MMGLPSKKLPRAILFLGLNVAILVLLLLFVVVPLLSHFDSRNDEIRENAAQLAHFHRIIHGARALEQAGAQNTQAFLTGSEERVLSADLQASLQALAVAKGVRVLGLRGLQSRRIAQMPTVAVGMDVEGVLGAVRDVIGAIEDQSPFLFITEAALRPIAEGDGNAIRAQLRVDGVVHELRATPPGRSEPRRVPELAGIGAEQ